MAKISTYPFPSSVSLSDYVIGTVDSSSNETKNFKILDIISLPGSTTYVPYTGATANVVLGTKSLSGFDITATNSLNTSGPITSLGVAGLSGQVLKSSGPGAAPYWSSLATSSGLYAQISLGTPVVFASGEASLIGTGVGVLSVPANAFVVGDSFVAKMCGRLTCSNNQVLHFRVRSNGVVIIDALQYTLATTTNKYFDLNLEFTVTKIGGPGVAELFANGSFSYNKDASSAIEGVNFGLVSNTVFDTTVLNTLSITAEWISSNAANTIRSQNFTLTKVY